MKITLSFYKDDLKQLLNMFYLFALGQKGLNIRLESKIV